MIKKLLVSLLLVFSSQSVVLRNGTNASQTSIDKLWTMIQTLYRERKYTTLSDLYDAAQKKKAIISLVGFDRRLYIRPSFGLDIAKMRVIRRGETNRHNEAIKKMIQLGICDKNRILTQEAVNIINSSIYNIEHDQEAVKSCSIQHPVNFLKRFRTNLKNISHKK